MGTKSKILMKQFWKEVLLLPYKSNTQDKPYHEKQVQNLLEKHGFTIITRAEFKKEYDGDIDKLPVGFGIYQPNSDQQPPDFRVKYAEGRIIDIECKSSKGTFPTYNGTLPCEDTVYIFCSLSYNKTTIYFSQDVVSEEIRKWMDETIDQLNEVLTDQQKKKPFDKLNRGMDYYIRNMFTQKGPGKKDYFKHSDCQLCESNVLNYNW